MNWRDIPKSENWSVSAPAHHLQSLYEGLTLARSSHESKPARLLAIHHRRGTCIWPLHHNLLRPAPAHPRPGRSHSPTGAKRAHTTFTASATALESRNSASSFVPSFAAGVDTEDGYHVVTGPTHVFDGNILHGDIVLTRPTSLLLPSTLPDAFAPGYVPHCERTPACEDTAGKQARRA